MSDKILKFSGGSFTIMQATDVHGIAKESPDTSRLLDAALDKIKPDLVVFTGDQIKGYGLSYLTGDKLEKVKQAIHNIAEPVNSRKIPFIVTFGNHDPQVGISLDKQLEIFKSYEHYVSPAEEFMFDAGTVSIPIMSGDGLRQIFNIYLVDSRGSAKGGGYAPVDKEQIEWYKSVREKLKEKNGGYIPSFVFQHIPVHEIYKLFERVSKKTAGAVQAFRTHKGKYYKLKKEISEKGGIFLEPPSIPDINTGEFEAMSEKGDVVGMFFGHDHKNRFVGNVGGVDLGYCPGCGFGEYGNGVERGVRAYILNESEPRNYSTYTVTYRELFGKKVLKPLKKAFYDKMPTSFDAAVPLIAKALGFIAALVLAVLLLARFL